MNNTPNIPHETNLYANSYRVHEARDFSKGVNFHTLKLNAILTLFF